MAGGENKTILLLYGAMLLAIISGIYAQDITYFLHYNLAIPLMVGLNLLTVSSISLFLLPPILISKSNKRWGIGEKAFYIYLSINIFIGMITSAFSLIVLIAWWG